MDRNALIDALVHYFSSQESVTVAYLFGSAARDEQLRLSDVDVGVLFGGGMNGEDRLLHRIRMAQGLEALTTRPVDVIDLERTPPHFNHQVLRYGVVLKGRAEPARIEFEKSVRRQYFDQLPHRQRYLDHSLRRLREGGQSGGAEGTDPATLEAARRLNQRFAERDRG